MKKDEEEEEEEEEDEEVEEKEVEEEEEEDEKGSVMITKILSARYTVLKLKVVTDRKTARRTDGRTYGHTLL